MTRSSQRRALPTLKPVETMVLGQLAQGERHGYGLVVAIEQATGGAVRLVPGNLYRVLRRLIERGLIVESDERPAAELDDQRRRYYGITERGLETLRLEVARLEELAMRAGRALARGAERGDGA